jgi:methenyltetrahydromethanopterin cyclohydrolase
MGLDLILAPVERAERFLMEIRGVVNNCFRWLGVGNDNRLRGGSTALSISFSMLFIDLFMVVSSFFSKDFGVSSESFSEIFEGFPFCCGTVVSV